MSLINEALKRAEADKLSHSSPFFNNLTVLTPVEDEVPPPPRPPLRLPRRRRFPPLGALGLVLILVGAVGAGFVWYRSQGEGGPGPLAAADLPSLPAVHPTATAAVNQPKPEAGAASLPAPGGKAVRVASAGTRGAPGAVAKPTATSKPAARPETQPAVAPRPVIAAAPTRLRHVVPPAPPPSPRVNPARFRLSAIMRGPEGNVALINGDLLQEGETVLGAKILKIGRYHVEFDLAGQRFIVRM